MSMTPPPPKKAERPTLLAAVLFLLTLSLAPVVYILLHHAFSLIATNHQLMDVHQAASPKQPFKTIACAGYAGAVVSIGEPSYRTESLASYQITGPLDPFQHATLVHGEAPSTEDGPEVKGRIVLQQFHGTSSFVVSYPVAANRDFFEPQLSPDGKWLLFKYDGRGDMCSQYHFFVWKLGTNYLREVSDEPISCEQLCFSPDSSKIAYVTGDERPVPRSTCGHVERLYWYDLNTGRNRFIVEHNFDTRPSFTSDPMEMRWASPSNLVFTGADGIYEATDGKARPERLFSGAFAGTVSPDGRWLTNFHVPYSLRQDQQFDDGAPFRLFLRDRQKEHGEPILMNTAPRTLVNVQWTPDSQQLITVESQYDPGTADLNNFPRQRFGPGTGKAIIRSLDVHTGNVREVALLIAHDADAGSYSSSDPQFDVQGVTPDGRYLLVAALERGPRVGFNCTSLDFTLRAVDLQSGAISTLDRGSSRGFDFHYSGGSG